MFRSGPAEIKPVECLLRINAVEPHPDNTVSFYFTVVEGVQAFENQSFGVTYNQDDNVVGRIWDRCNSLLPLYYELTTPMLQNLADEFTGYIVCGMVGSREYGRVIVGFS